MNKRNTAWFFISLLGLLVTCQLQQPKFINHPRPNLSVTSDIFLAECLNDPSRQCLSESTQLALGCDRMREPPSLLGGLDPAYPIAICVMRQSQLTIEDQQEIEQGLYFYQDELFGYYARYVIFQNGEFQLLKSEEEFRAMYAPIETPEEALSYVLAVTGHSAYYDQALENPSFEEYKEGIIEDTHVTLEPDGYRMNVFHRAGCGPYRIVEVEMHVSTEGVIQEIGRKLVYLMHVGCPSFDI